MELKKNPKKPIHYFVKVSNHNVSPHVNKAIKSSKQEYKSTTRPLWEGGEEEKVNICFSLPVDQCREHSAMKCEIYCLSTRSFLYW